MATSKRTTARTSSTPRRRPARRPMGDYICNLVPTPDTSRDWTIDDGLAAGALQAAPLPPSVDLRASWWGVNDQESTGSCVGWATADGVVRYHMVRAGRITQRQMLSPRHVWMASKETDGFTTTPETFIERAGTMLKTAVDVARKSGVALETDLPFHIQTLMYGGPENAFYASCAQRKIASYFNLRRNPGDWKTWLASNGPILAGLSVDASWDHAKATAGDIDGFQPATVRGGHAIAVVGYRADGTFIVRNSWGTSWGDKGFGYVTPAYIAAGFFDESYGVTL